MGERIFMASVELTWPSDLGDQNSGQPNYILFTAKDRVLGRQETILGSVALPIPLGALVSNYKANYDQMSLGILGSVAMDTINSQKLGGGANAKQLEAEFDQQGLAASTKELVASAANVGPAALNKFKNNVLGTIKNPFQFVSYTGPEFRSYSMNWTMIPTNSGDALKISNIAKFFKKHVLPKEGKIADKATYFEMPPTFDVEIRLHKLADGTPVDLSSKEGRVQRFAKCVLTNVEVDYNGIGALVPTFFHDAHPTGTKLTIGLQETQLITSTMIDKGF